MDTPPTVGAVVAANLRETRFRARLSTRDVEQRLREAGYPMSYSTVAKSEAEDPERRRAVDVEELVALALVLGTSPVRLLMPTDAEEVALTPERSASAGDVAAWILSDVPLSGEPRRRRSATGHPAVQAAERLAQLVDQVLRDRAQAMLEPADARPQSGHGPSTQQLIDRLRQAAALTTRYVDLLIDELQWDDYPGGGS